MAPRKITQGPEEDAHGDSPTTASNGSPISDSRNIFPFLSLPAELRANILSLTAQEQDAHIIPNGPPHPLAFHSLEAVNRQVRTEFIASLYLFSRNLISTVKNFNFSHIVAFLALLSDAEVAGISNGPREFRIDITITKYPPTTHSQNPHLQTWLDYFDNPANKGTDIQFDYSMVRNMTSSVGCTTEQHERLNELCFDWQHYFNEKEPIEIEGSKVAQWDLLWAALCECKRIQMDHLLEYED